MDHGRYTTSPLASALRWSYQRGYVQGCSRPDGSRWRYGSARECDGSYEWDERWGVCSVWVSGWERRWREEDAVVAGRGQNVAETEQFFLARNSGTVYEVNPLPCRSRTRQPPATLRVRLAKSSVPFISLSFFLSRYLTIDAAERFITAIETGRRNHCHSSPSLPIFVVAFLCTHSPRYHCQTPIRFLSGRIWMLFVGSDSNIASKSSILSSRSTAFRYYEDR